MIRILQAGLILACAWAVLAFGGTDPLLFSGVQILLVVLALLAVVSYGSPSVGHPRLPWAVPVALVILPALQLVPLPAGWVEILRGRGPLAIEPAVQTLSISPADTKAYLLYWLCYLVVFYLTIVICRERQQRRTLVVALVSMAGFEAVYGMLQYLTGWQQIFTYVKKTGLSEATGTYINHNHFAGLLEMVLPFVLAFAIYHFSRLWRRQAGEGSWGGREESETEPQKLLFWLFLGAFLFAAVVFSHSRMGLVATVVSALVMMGAMSSTGSVRQKRMGLVVVVLFLVAGLAMALWLGAEPVVERFAALEGELSVQQSRWGIWEDTLPVIEQAPLLGTGLGTFASAYTATQSVYLTRIVDHAHNDYLQVTAELGLVGALLVFGSIFFLLGATFRTFLAGQRGREQALTLGCIGSLVAILLHSLTDFNLYIPANAMIFCVVLGLSYSIVYGPPRQNRERSERRREAGAHEG